MRHISWRRALDDQWASFRRNGLLKHLHKKNKPKLVGFADQNAFNTLQGPRLDSNPIPRPKEGTGFDMEKIVNRATYALDFRFGNAGCATVGAYKSVNSRGRHDV